MKTVRLPTEVQLAELVDAVANGEEVLVLRDGKPVAKLTGLAVPKKRKLGFYPIAFKSDLLEPTDNEILDTFY